MMNENQDVDADKKIEYFNKHNGSLQNMLR
jgi:hypothetical protein